MRENTPGAPVEGKKAVGPPRNDASRRGPGALGAKNPTGSTHVNYLCRMLRRLGIASGIEDLG
jgi:hypothetical protein